MEIQFWYCGALPNTNIKNSIEKIDNTILFKNIYIDEIDPTKLNFLVLLLETEWTNSSNSNVAHTHTKEFMELMVKLQSNNFYFMLDNSGEAELWVDGLSSKFFDLLNKNKIDFNRLIVINNDSSKIGLNKTRYGNFILNTCFFPNFFLSTYNQMNEYVTINEGIKPDKKFLCLNRRMNLQKYQIIEELFNKGLIKDTRFTWVRNLVPINKISKELILEYNIDVNNFKSIQLEGDVMYGSDLSRHDEFLFTINPNWYYKSKVNIITETTLYKNSIHLTEKTWKALYMGIPFVIYSPSRNYLKTLRDMGFKTFNSVINEDYDSIIGNDKITQIINSAEELVTIYNTREVLDICRFNQELYFNFEHRKRIYEEGFLNKIHDVQNLTNPKTLI